MGTLRRNKTYKTENKRYEFRESVKFEVESLSEQYSKSITKEKYINNIEKLSNSISKKHGNCLVGKRFRIGSAQKALNLYLKYLWRLDRIDEPPLFTLDGTMLNYIQKHLDIKIQWSKKELKKRQWTKLDNIGI